MRTFGRMLFFLLVVWLVIPSPAQAVDASSSATNKVLYMVADAHLDDEWNWTIQDSINTFIPNTLHQNFTLLATYAHYVFNWEESWRYQLVQEYYPADYITLTNYIAQGRWRVSGAGVVAGDVNVPSPEALIRQALFAEDYYNQTFGKTSLDILLPDCFGYSYALPSVAAHCGIKGFSGEKLEAMGCWTNIPFNNIGRWIGPDGNSVVAVLKPGSYSATISANLANDASELTRITNNFAQTGLYLDYRYYGTGDRGGAPDSASVNWIEQSVTTTNGLLTVLSAGSDQMYRDLTASQTNQLPTWHDELLLQSHGAGGLTAHSEMKTYNRKNEQRADAAERAAVIADWLQGGGAYPQEKLNKAWTSALWCQFHDILPGTSIDVAYTFAWNDELLALNQFGSEETHGEGILARAMDTTAQGVPLIVYNPLSIARQDIVEATVTFTNGVPTAVRVYDGNGNEVPSQMGAPVGNTATVIFLADVPATGSALYDVRSSPTPSALNTGLTISTSQLENARYRVQLNANGDVSSIFDKVNNREMLNAPIRWAFLYDQSTTWPNWEIQYAALTGPPLSCLGESGTPTYEILENGPARVSLGVTRFNSGSTFTERIRLASGDAGDRVEWDVSANWGTLKTLLKMTFPMTVTNSLATFDLGLGTIQRPNENANRYDVPAQQWADLTSANNTYGISILNDSKYGWDKPDNSTLRLSIFHTPDPGSNWAGPYQAFNSIGTHRFLVAIMGHTNDWRSGGSAWTAARLNQPLQAFQTIPHAGNLGKSFGFLSCNNSNVMVKAIKKAENSNEVIVRLQELTGQAQTGTLTCASAITAARQVSGTEAPINTLTPAGGTLTVSLGGYSPMTLALTLAAPAALVTKPASTPVTLPYNLDAISTDANRTNGNFDGGYTYPAELMPTSIIRDGITFQLGPINDGAFNTLSCTGQVIAVNGSGYDRLYILAAAAANDMTAPFTVNGQSTNLTVRYFTDFIGQWNPPILKKDEVAWVCTHRHDGAGANDAYRFCYLFKYRIDLPPGASTLTLPNSPNIRIFAMSLGKNTTADTMPAGGSLVDNQLPWVSAGTNQLLNADDGGTATVTLDGVGSTDPDGTMVSFNWSENGIPAATGIRPVVNLAPGTHTMLLTVTDNHGGTGQGMTTITVLTPLTVTVNATPTSSNAAPLTVQFSGQGSGGSVSASCDTTDDHQGLITAQGQNPPNEVATKAFDDTLGSKWLDFASAYPGTRSSWIQYQYSNGLQRVVTNYTITSANDAQVRDPMAWRLLGSNNNGTNWVQLDSRTNQTFLNRNQEQAYSTTNTAAYNIYRLQIDSVANPGSANSVQLDEIRLRGVPFYSYFWSFGDGTTSTEQNPQHTYTSNGTFTAVLSVSYDIYTGTNTVTVTIGPPPAATVHGIPYTWLASYGIANTNNSVETENPDGDKLNNLQEYIVGTDPTNANSCFSVSITNSVGQAIVRVPSIQATGLNYVGKARYYDIEQCINLLIAAWQPVPNYTNILGNGGIITCTNAVQNPAAFYRAKVRLK
jgi:alpha-mannosidase